MAAKKKPAKRPARRATRRPKKKPPAAAPGSHAKRQEPENLRLRAAMPSYTVNDLERSLAFYCDILGFFVKDRWEEGGQLVGVELVAGSVSIGLSQDDFSKGRDRVKGVGNRLWCTTAQDVDALAARIRRRGGQLDEGPINAPWGARMLTVTDPDGFKVSIAHGE
jgi:lactoylglutathione lyase